MKRVVNYTDLKEGDSFIIYPEYDVVDVVDRTRTGILRINYRSQLYTLGAGRVLKFKSGVTIQNLGKRGHFGRRSFIRVERDENHHYERVRAQSPLELRA